MGEKPVIKAARRIAPGQVCEWSVEDQEWLFIVNGNIKGRARSLKAIMKKAEIYNEKRKFGE